MGRRRGTKIIRRKILDAIILEGKSKSYNIYLFKLECGHVEQRGYSPSVHVTFFGVKQGLIMTISCSSCAYNKDNADTQNFWNEAKEKGY